MFSAGRRRPTPRVRLVSIDDMLLVMLDVDLDQKQHRDEGEKREKDRHREHPPKRSVATSLLASP